MRMSNSRTPPFPAIEDDVVSLNNGRSLHVRRIGRGDVRFRHTERGTNLAGQQRLKPTQFLRGRAILHQHFHVAGVRCVAVENLGRDERAPGNLSQGRVFHIRKASPILFVRKKQIPQPSRPSLGLQSFHNRRLLPLPPVGDILHLRIILRLSRQNVVVHKRREALNIFLGFR